MAIVKMKRFTLIGIEDERMQVLDKLAQLKAIEISSVSEEIIELKNQAADTIDTTGNIDSILDVAADSADTSPLDQPQGRGLSFSHTEEQLNRIKECMDTLIPFDKRKKGLFTVKRDVTMSAFKHVTALKDRLITNANKVISIKNSIASIKLEENRLMAKIEILKPWEGLPFRFEEDGTKYTVFLTGTLPEEVDIESFQEELNTEVPEFHIQLISQSSRYQYCWLTMHKNVMDPAVEFLRKNGFSFVEFTDFTGTAAENIEKCNIKLKELERERIQKTEELSKLALQLDNFEMLYDYLRIEDEKQKAAEGLLSTGNAFVIEGWIPQRISESFSKVMQEGFTCHIVFSDPQKSDDIPVLLDNYHLVKPFESITEMYSLPSSSDVDPSLFMAPFFFVLFGIMLGDAAYGIILSLTMAFVIKKWGPKGMSGKVIRLLFLCGISTFIWGALFGSWFGDLAQVASGGRFSIPPLWFSPLEEPVKMLILSFGIGGLHIITALLVKAWMMIKEGDIAGAIYDVFSWIILLLSPVFLLIGGVGAEIGKYMAICGSGVIILFAGREKKNFLLRIFSGLGSLYSISGYLSDILSYSRLLALGLATGVIASVINTMGSLLGSSIPGIIFYAVLIAFGTIFNIALNALGSFVHTSRLQYIEFFGKFYEGGGRAFVPMGSNTKYIDIISENKERQTLNGGIL